MSIFQLQINDSHNLPQSDTSSLKTRHQQLTGLLIHAISIVENDEERALDFVRRASALAGRLELLDRHPERSIRGLAPWQADRVRRHIENNYAGRIGIDELAAMTRLSTSHFSAAFRLSFGTSPHDYVCRKRVEQAQHQMTTTDKPLCEIALDCGFADQPHLCRVFRRITGQTPAAWRRNKRTF